MLVLASSGNASRLGVASGVASQIKLKSSSEQRHAFDCDDLCKTIFGDDGFFAEFGPAGCFWLIVKL